MAYTNKKKENKIKINIDIDTLNLIISYTLMSEYPELITTKSLINLQKLINEIDYDRENFEYTWHYELIKTILDGEINKKLFRIELLKDYVMTNLSSNYNIESLSESFDDYAQDVLQESDVIYINTYVSERLTYLYLFKNQDSLENALENLKNNKDIINVNTEFENVVGKLNKEIQTSKAITNYEAMDFSINDISFEDSMRKTIAEIDKPANYIKTGIQFLNKMLNGGFECGRCYLIFALPKSFKSGLMLNICIWACRYNEFKPKDIAKTPTVLYVTQENSQRETIERLYFHIKGEELKGKNYLEATKVIREYLSKGKERSVDFKVVYRPNKTISTLDLDAMIDDLALQGKEVVMIVHDYTKRIRSDMNYPDPRLELGEVVNNLADIAKIRNIPVISAGQLNRDAYRVIETCVASKRGNLTKELNKSHVGESALMIENTDYAFIINPEEDPTTGERLLGFKLIASRGGEPKMTYFLQKFENGMKLEEDVTLNKALSITDATNSQKQFNPNNARSLRKVASMGGRKRINEIKPDDNDTVVINC